MAWALLLATAAGGLTGLGIWWLLGAKERSAGQHLSRRLKRIASGSAASPTTITRESRYSAVPELRQLLRRFTATPNILLFLEQAGSPLNVSSYVALHLACAVASIFLVAVFRFHFIPALIVIVGATTAPLIVMLMKRQRRFQRMTEQLVDAVRLMSSAMRAGLGFDAGLEFVATELPEPSRGEFRKLLNEWRLYGDMSEALRRFARRIPVPDVCLFAASARLHREIGGNFTELLDQLEVTIRNRFQLQRELKTLTAEGRLSGVVLGALPFVVGIAICVLNPRYFRLLLETPAGRVMLWIGLGLQIAGFFIIRWITTPRIR